MSDYATSPSPELKPSPSPARSPSPSPTTATRSSTRVPMTPPMKGKRGRPAKPTEGDPTTPPKAVKRSKNSGSGSSLTDSPSSPGEWTPEKREVFMDRVIAAGYKALDLGQMAQELGLNKKQMINQLTTGRKGSFRDKAVKHIRGDK